MKKYGLTIVFAILGIISFVLAIICVFQNDWPGYCVEMSQTILNINMIVFDRIRQKV